MKKPKRTVEIYFVLYLAALIFLLPIGRNDDNSIENVRKEIFNIQPLKTNLTARLFADSVGNNIIGIDSINTIIYSGNFDDVRFEFTIEDRIINQKLVLSSLNGNESPYFRVLEIKQQQSAYFFWMPPPDLKENRTYLVRVKAFAKRKNEFGNIEKFEAQTQFSLIAIFINSIKFGDNSFALNGNDTIENASSNLTSNLRQSFPNTNNEIELSIEELNVRAMAYQNWTNEIYLRGANPRFDLAQGYPKLQLDKEPNNNSGTAEVLKLDDYRIIISGKTPSSGRLKVSTKLKFKNKDKIYDVDFIVSAMQIAQPQYERYIYPEKEYSIDPNVPFTAGRDIKTFIKEGDKIRAVSDQGTQFKFSPDISDTGKVLTLESYIDGNLYGQKYQIRVLAYPEPKIEIQYISPNEVRIITKCYGQYRSNPNSCNLEITGNANWSESRGSIPRPSDNITIVQIFKCFPKDKDKPFEFKVKAIDARGLRSKTETYGIDR